ncbi:tetratricopeptide repeat protein [Flavobacterium tegetincola]|uniref:type IX secretion system periplasmic lipoprotein PorW/SprE n=1 Tax=Flavobacterium tegetincola TaxID=150172 RepID=UPI0012FC727D|nr:tetratricopeptide repeat protein [Flavobacterium tegetincola]
MKNKLIKSLFLFGIFGILIACSTQKDRFLNRKFQALNTQYNVLYNGDLALDKGIEDLKSQYNDDFWQLLPVERMVVSKDNNLPGENTKNANFERAEEKATKAIQRRSMNIDGREVNSQMDEAHLLLGKARYYDLRFVPALEAFNYVLYKYPESDKIYEVKIWREKTNMRMENDAIAVVNLRKLLREIKFKDQIFADANATLAQAFLNLEEKDSALVKLKVATEFTKLDEEKARYQFITGQLLNGMGQKDSAFASFQSVIDMKRKSPRRYVIQAHLQQASAFDYKKGDTIAFLEKFNDLLEDRENRPFLDYLNHQMALFYDKQDNHKEASKFYNKSLKAQGQDQYLVASNYRNLATLNFDDAKYPTAGKYYDSTLTVLDARTREHKSIKKKRENLEDVIKYEAIAQANDSILNLVQMSKAGQTAYFEKYITDLKASDKKAAEVLKRQQEIAEIKSNSALLSEDNPGAAMKNTNGPPREIGPKSNESFYFYNPSTVAFGKNEFRKKWGKRNLNDNWRWSQNAQSNDTKNLKEEKTELLAADKEKLVDGEQVENPAYTTAFYIEQLPTEKAAIDLLIKDRNFAYYQLGVIYKEKFKEYELAAAKLEKLLENNPEERLILPSMYNLFKIYEIINPAKALAMKQQIVSKYPDSRYAQIIANDGLNAEQLSQTPEAKYESLYKKYEINTDVALLNEVEEAIDLYTGDEIVSKFELLKATIVGKLKGVEEFKTALNFVALNYPNSQEGKTAETLLAKNIPYLQKLKLNSEKATSWKLVYKVADTLSTQNKSLIDKIKKFTSERTVEKLSYSIDNYYMDEILLIMHGIPTEEKAKDIATILRDYKDFQIKQPVIIVSSENYKVIQIQKTLDVYVKSQEVVKTEIKTEQKQEGTTTAKLEGKTEGQPDAKTQVQNETKAELKPASKKESTPEGSSEKFGPPGSIEEVSEPAKKP